MLMGISNLSGEKLKFLATFGPPYWFAILKFFDPVVLRMRFEQVSDHGFSSNFEI